MASIFPRIPIVFTLSSFEYSPKNENAVYQLLGMTSFLSCVSTLMSDIDIIIIIIINRQFLTRRNIVSPLQGREQI